MTNRPHGRQETGSTASASDLQGGHATPDAKTTLSRRDFGVLLLGLGAAAQMGFPTEAEAAGPLVFAIIGDYGWQQQPNEAAVAALVKSWNPQFIVTNGDNNYGEGNAAQQDATQGSAATIDKNIGQYYHDFIYPYNGAYGPSADINRFFPILADKDWNPVTGYQAYLDYFTLPGNERYYDFVWGPVHFFMLNSDLEEPDSPFLGGPQSAWLQQRLAASTAPWKLVHLHNPPYSSNTSFTRSQWPFAQWGANVVSSGQAHVYERILRDGIVYFINGLGGRSRGDFPPPPAVPVEGSQVRFGDAFGAQRVTVTPDSITFEFFTVANVLIDRFTLTKNTPAAPTQLTATASSPTRIELVWEDQSGIEGGYRVERSTDGSQFAEIASLPANTTAYADTTAAPGTQYHYRVRAFQGTVFSGYSNVANATTPSAPGAPTQLTATAVSPTQVELAWKDNTSNEDGFKVERSTDGTNFTEIASLAANTTTYAETVVAPATQYHYRVRAFLGTLFSEYSNVAQVPNNAPVANAGPDQNFKTTTELLTTVTLSGSGTDVDGDPLSFQWIFEGNVIATGTQATVQLPFGNHTVILAARDPRGAVGMDTVQIRIPLPPSTNDAKITGSGTIPAPGGTGSFSVSAQYKNGKHSGAASWSGPNGVEVTGTEIAGVYVNGTRGQVYGVGRLTNGNLVRFRMDVEDQGNPGKNDQLTLALTNGYSAGGRLSGGNVKIH